MSFTAINAAGAPRPAGTYSHAVEVGKLVFLAGQTPRDATGKRWGDSPFDKQVRVVLDNLQAIARATGLSLHDAVKVTVYLRDTTLAAQFDAIYAEYAGEAPAARTLVQSSLNGFDVEVDAILARP